MSISIKTDNPNYLARVVAMPELRVHPNADKLSLVTIQGQTIITGRDAKAGGLYVLFQLESKINRDFLAFINGFDKAELNNDKTKKSFFSEKCRVKAIRLRGVLSEGYLHPVADVNRWLKSIGLKHQLSEADLNIDFDTVDTLLFVEKYVNVDELRKIANVNRVKGGKVKRESRIVENQFRLSPDYKHLKREIDTLKPDDWIEITGKIHGANGVISKVLTKRPLNFIERFVKKLGVKVSEFVYSLVYSSRRVIKSEEFRDNEAQSFYDANVWELVAKKYADSIQDSLTLYGEVVGFTPTGGAIQSANGKPYDYGCEPCKCDFWVFRITTTTVSGNVYEWSLQAVVDYCTKLGLRHVPVYYIGKAKDKYPTLDVTNHWHEAFLAKLIEEYLEKDDIYCKSTGLFDEGVVLSKRVGGFEGLKLKSAKFLLQETKELDKGTANIEDEESVASNDISEPSVE